MEVGGTLRLERMLSLSSTYISLRNASHASPQSDSRRGLLPRSTFLTVGQLDRVIFSRAFQQLGRLSPEHVLAVEAAFSAPELLDRVVDHAFVFVTAPAVSLEREERNKLVFSAGSCDQRRRASLLRHLAEEVRRRPRCRSSQERPPSWIEAI